MNFGNNFNGGYSSSAFASQPLGLDAMDNTPLGGLFDNVGSDDLEFGLPDMKNDQQGLSISIRKVYLGDTRRQAQQHRRNFNAFVDGETYDSIQEAVARRPDTLINPEAFSEFLTENSPIIRYNSTTEGKVNIANGWDTPRFRFTLVVDVYRGGHYQRTEFVSGYTDYDGVNNRALANSVTIDPHLLFTINQVTYAGSMRTNVGGAEIPLITESHQVLRHSGFRGINGPQLMTMRPTDMVGAYRRLPIYKGFSRAEELGAEDDATSYRDITNAIGGRPVMSRSDNLLIPTFTTRVVRALTQGNTDMNDGINPDEPYGLPHASRKMVADRIQEAVYSGSNFVHVVNRKLGNGITNTGEFTFGDLLMLDPTVDDRTLVFGLTFDRSQDGLYIPDGSEVDDIGQATNCAIAATALSNSLVQLMSKAGVQMISIHIDNLTGIDEAIVQACVGMDYDHQLASRLEMLKHRMITEAIPVIKPDPLSIYEVDILADAFNDVFIEIRLDGERDQFLIPAYASSSFAPILTEDRGTIIGMAEAIDRVVDACESVGATNNTGILDSMGNPFGGFSENSPY